VKYVIAWRAAGQIETAEGIKLETRNQKPEIRMKLQTQNPNWAHRPDFSGFWFGYSFWFLVSDFGFDQIAKPA